MICERCTYGRGSHSCHGYGTRGLATSPPPRRAFWQTTLQRSAQYADALVEITQELRDTADMIARVESEPRRIGALMDSSDWRDDEIKDLHRHVASLRARIGRHAGA